MPRSLAKTMVSQSKGMIHSNFLRKTNHHLFSCSDFRHLFSAFFCFRMAHYFLWPFGKFVYLVNICILYPSS